MGVRGGEIGRGRDGETGGRVLAPSSPVSRAMGTPSAQTPAFPQGGPRTRARLQLEWKALRQGVEAGLCQGP